MKYYIWGTGYEGEKFIYHNPDILGKISGVIDSKHAHEMWHGMTVLSFDEFKDVARKGNIFIYIAAAEEPSYCSMRNLLVGNGYKEFEDFMWTKSYGKKLVLINANCHGDAIYEFLQSSQEFISKYYIHRLPAIQDNSIGEIADTILSKADLYIHQDIRKDNKISYKLSDEYILSKLPENCLNITIPNLVGFGSWLYPQLGGLDKYIEGMNQKIYVYYRDYAIDEAVEKGINTLDGIYKYWINYDFEKAKLQELFNKSMSRIAERDDLWDIHISEYISAVYKKIPCYVDRDHPSKYVLGEICEQLANILALKDVKEYKGNGLGLPTPILPCVKRFFDLKFEVEEEKRGSICLARNDKVVDSIEEYIRGYMWWYYEVRV